VTVAEFVYYAALGAVWGWVIGVWTPLLTDAIARRWYSSRWHRALEHRRFARWYGSLTPREQASLDTLAERMATVVRATGVSAAEATAAFGRLL
jgi:hypothetical protein